MLNKGTATMKQQLKKIKKHEWAALSLLLVMLVTNPLTESYIGSGIDWMFAQLVTYGSFINLGSTVLFIAYIAVRYRKATKITATNARDK